MPEPRLTPEAEAHMRRLVLCREHVWMQHAELTAMLGEIDRLRSELDRTQIALAKLEYEQGHYYDAGDLLAEAQGGPQPLTALERMTADRNRLRTYFCADHLPTAPNEIQQHVPCVQCLADWFEAKCEEAAVERDRLRALATRYSLELSQWPKDDYWDHDRRLKEIANEP